MQRDRGPSLDLDEFAVQKNLNVLGTRLNLLKKGVGLIDNHHSMMSSLFPTDSNQVLGNFCATALLRKESLV